MTRAGARSLEYAEPSASEIWNRVDDGARRGAVRGRARTSGPEGPPVPAEPADQSADAVVARPPRPPRPALRVLERHQDGPGAPGLGTGRRPTRTASAAATSAKKPLKPRKTPAQKLAAKLTAGASAGVGVTREPNDPAVLSRLADAARAYAADRYQDSLRMLRRLSVTAPESAAVKELLGLTLYRLGRWPLALKQLQEHHVLTGSFDQYPVIADCLRAMRRYDESDEVWSELRQASPSAEVVTEGRLVAAGSLADRGDLKAAVKLLEPSVRRSKPKGMNLRQWYVLADLYERAGELPRARELFLQIAAADPDAYDVRQRLVALR